MKVPEVQKWAYLTKTTALKFRKSPKQRHLAGSTEDKGKKRRKDMEKQGAPSPHERERGGGREQKRGSGGEMNPGRVPNPTDLLLLIISLVVIFLAARYQCCPHRTIRYKQRTKWAVVKLKRPVQTIAQ